MTDVNQKREAALIQWQLKPGQLGSAEGFRAGYDAALADNAERVREIEQKLDDWNENRELLEYPCNCEYCVVEWVRKTDLVAAESALAEARATIERVQVLRRYDLVETALASSYESYRDMRADVTGEWIKLEDLVEALKPVKP